LLRLLLSQKTNLFCVIISIIIIIIIIISFIKGIYIYIPETNYVPREYSVAAIQLSLFMVLIYYYYYYYWGHAVAQLVEAPRYKPEGRGFDSGW